MRILLTIENARERAGSKQYVHTLASAYAEEGHEVIVGSLDSNMGAMGEDIREIPGVTLVPIKGVVDAHRNPRMTPFDLGIIAPAKCLAAVSSLCKQTIQVTHGVVSAEAPREYADFNVFVSEEARDHWGIEGTIIRNPIDTDRYACADPSRSRLEAVAHFSNYDDIDNLQDACHQLGVRLNRIKHRAYPEVIELLTDSDMIFAVGRSAYEAMSMGREVVFCDNRSYYGVDGSLGDGLASEVYGHARKYNCSGRWGQAEYTVENFVEILEAYDLHRMAICTYHDHRIIAAELLEVAGL